ncbi:unnamed protein product [Caenorhabditis brenneri]
MEHLFWRSILSYFKYFCSTCSTCFNIILILLVSFRSPKSLGAYKYLMIYISAFDLFYSLWDAVTEPVVYSYGSAFTVFRNCQNSIFNRDLSFIFVLIYCGCFIFSLACFGVHFLYRYGTLNINFRERYLSGKKTSIPFILMYTPLFFVFALPLFNINFSYASTCISATISIYTAIDPLPSMFIIKTYRKAIIRALIRVLTIFTSVPADKIPRVTTSTAPE